MPNYVDDVGDCPDRIDLNYVLDGGRPGQPDWNHLNGIEYNAERDEIAIELTLVQRVLDRRPRHDHRGGAGRRRRPEVPLRKPRNVSDRRPRDRAAASTSSTTLNGSSPVSAVRATSSSSTTALRKARSSAPLKRSCPRSGTNGDYVRDPAGGGFSADDQARVPEAWRRRRGRLRGHRVERPATAERQHAHRLRPTGPSHEVTPRGARSCGTSRTPIPRPPFSPTAVPVCRSIPTGSSRCRSTCRLPGLRGTRGAAERRRPRRQHGGRSAVRGLPVVDEVVVATGASSDGGIFST